MKKLNGLDVLSLILVIIGALNWILVGLFSFDLVAAVFGELSALTRIIYIVVGLAGIYLLFTLSTLCRKQVIAKTAMPPTP